MMMTEAPGLPKLERDASLSPNFAQSAKAGFFSETGPGKGLKKTRNWYQCRRCRYHGQFVFLAGGHYQVCPFRNCSCQACRYVSKDTERAGQRMREWRRTKKERQYPAKPTVNRIPAPGHPSVPSPAPLVSLAMGYSDPGHPRFPLPLLPASPRPELYPPISAYEAGQADPMAALQAAVAAEQRMLQLMRRQPLSLPTVVRPNSPSVLSAADAARVLELQAAAEDEHRAQQRRASMEEEAAPSPKRSRDSAQLPHSNSSSPAMRSPGASPKAEPVSPVSVIVGVGKAAASPESGLGEEDEEWSLGGPEAIVALIRLAQELGCGVWVAADGQMRLESRDAKKRLRLSDLGHTVRLVIESDVCSSDNQWPKAGSNWEQFLMFVRTLLVTLVEIPTPPQSACYF